MSETTFMQLFSESVRFVRCKNGIPLLFLLIFTLVSCSSDDVPVQLVDSTDRLSELELQQLNQQQRAELQLETYYFGFDLRASPQEDTAQYIPFLNYLEVATGYHFKIYFTPKNSSAADELGQNRSQFAAIGATGFLYAEARYGIILLAQGRNQQGKTEYQSVFVVKNNNDSMRNIGDIRGRKLAFGSRDSTQGHLIPRIMLAENGISLDDLSSYSYMGSHQKCAEAVVSGEYDVCGMQDQLAQKLVSDGQIKIIHRSRYYPSSGIAANVTVPAEVIEKVRQALLDFEPQGKNHQGLYHWDRTEMSRGFAVSRRSDYNHLRQWSRRLGFLHDSDAQESDK